MSLDNATVRTIANLARIEVPEADLPHLAKELSTILGWVEQLGQVDTEGVAPLASVTGDLALPWRADAVTDGAYPDKILANAPEAANGFFLVPKVVE
ncbi:MAG: Asp-tRNA(Asn)/Glu-tRNA(Gln) amidotransferase subunit GatC [Rhodospirillales bacterium]|nr:Asp-tRNA(Asn)/Glu-tRNA(Gln) amidotransferase subunit GatC [Rhodospirillales bacterium]